VTAPRTARAPRTLDEALVLLATGTAAALFDEGGARRYRGLARLLHPDTVPAHRKAEAEAAFTRLTAMWQHHRATGGGTAVLTTRHRSYRLGPTLATGDLAALRAADEDTVLKIPLRPSDNDLMEREALALARLDRHGAPEHRAYAPRLIETFRHREGASGVERRVNALERLRGFHTLAEVGAAHPGGLDPRDAAWMWRRLLVALGWAHRASVVHGAVLPEHVLIHPGRHGLVLLDWCYAVVDEPEGTIPALVERYRDWYPPEVIHRRPATPATDIQLAARCVERLLGGEAPHQIRAHLRGCTLPDQARRPRDAWRLLGELDELLERLYGPRTFRPFTMPQPNDSAG
jgi:serine/threonine protein kinase